MQLIITSLIDQPVAFEVDISSDTVASLKEKISAKMGIPSDHQQLTLGEIELQDSDQLFKYKITDNSTVALKFVCNHEVKVLVKTLCGSMNYMMKCKPSDTIESLKAQIEAESGIANEQMQLIADGRILENSDTLNLYGSHNESSVHLELK